MVAAGVLAQHDSLLRGRWAERQFNPTLKDAAKISSLTCPNRCEKTEHGVCFVGGTNESAV